MAARAPPRDAVGSARARRRLLAEESQYFARGVGAAGFGIGPRGAAAGPGMAGAVEHPLLQNRSSRFISLDGAVVAYAAGSFAVNDRRPQIRPTFSLGDHLVTVRRIDRPVAISMKHNGRHYGASRAGSACL